MRRVLALTVGLAALLAASSPALAQRITGTLFGSVKDDSGAVLPGVTVTLRGEAVVGVQSSVTNEHGLYRFTALPPGLYDVTFVLSGFGTLNRKGIQVSVGGTLEENVELKVKQMEEEITVIGDTPVVDSTTNTVSTNYDKDWVRNAPIPRFTFFDLINAAPGISASTSGSSRATALGSATDENSYQIDGTNLTSSFIGSAWPWPNTDAIEEIEVLSLGAPAEYGNVSGAVFNVVTRQGSNTFHGDVNFYLQTDGLTRRNTTEAEDNGFPFHREKFKDATVQLSGPIMKDKLWFFASYQYQRDYKSPEGVDPRFFTREEADRVFGKINWQISPKHKLVFGYHNDYYYLPGTPNENTAPSTIGVEHGDNPTPNLMYTGVLSDKTILEGRVSGFFGNDHSDPLVSGQPRVETRFIDLDTSAVTGGIYYWYDNNVFQQGVSAKISHFADNFLGGSHDFKFGVQYSRGGVDNGVIGYNDLVYTYSYGGNKYAYGYQYQPFSYGGITKGVGIFADDAYRVSDRLTLNLGLRYDHNQAGIPKLDLRDQSGAPTGQALPARTLYTWNTFAPRVGFKLKLTADGKTVLGGHYGRYYRGVVVGEYSNAIGVSPHVTRSGTYDLAAGAFVDPEVTEFSENLGVDPGYKNPYTDQFIVSLDRELFKNVGLSLNYVHKRGRNFSAWRDTRGAYETATYVDSEGAQATGREVPVTRLLSDPAERFFVQTNPAQMKTDVNAFTAQVKKRMSNRWQMVASYTYLDSKGLLPSGRSGPASSQVSSLIFSDFGQNPNDFVNAAGRLVGERPHTFKTQLVAELPLGFLVGLNYLYETGRVWARTIRVPDLGFPSDPTVQMEQRDGSRRLPAHNLLDLRFQKDVRFGKEARFSLFADVLNVFNDDANESLLTRRGDSEDFGVPSAFLLPRRVMVGAKFTF